MIKVFKTFSQHVVLYEGAQTDIDEDIYGILDWYGEKYGTEETFRMLTKYSFPLNTNTETKESE